MLTSKENFSDRFSQTFKILKENFTKLFLPFFIYNFISIVILWTISKYYFYTSFLAIKWENTINYFGLLNNPIIIILIIIWVLLFIWYLILFIPIFLALIKSINQIYNEEEINYNENLKYWFSNILNSFKTYWYIFVYVSLIPAIIFIFWWLLFNIWLYFNNLKYLVNIWWIIIFISLLIFIFYSIYRWIKAKFALYSAVSNNNFTKNDFNNSISITENNWRRIFWNLFLLWILLSIIISIIWWIIWLFMFVNSNPSFITNFFHWYDSTLNIKINNPNEFLETFKSYFNNFSFLSEIINKTINTVLQTFSSIITIIFIFLLFKRLKLENEIPVLEINNKTIEKENIITEEIKKEL